MDITIGQIKSPDSEPPLAHDALGLIKSPDSEPPLAHDTLGPIKSPDSEPSLAHDALVPIKTSDSRKLISLRPNGPWVRASKYGARFSASEDYCINPFGHTNRSTVLSANYVSESGANVGTNKRY